MGLNRKKTMSFRLLMAGHIHPFFPWLGFVWQSAEGARSQGKGCTGMRRGSGSFQGEDGGPGAPIPHPPEAQSPGVVEPEHQSPDVSFTDAYTNTHTPGPNS